MSKATKRKHVMREVTDEFVLPDEQKQIVRVVASRGNNLHEVETDKAVRYLASMPTKFRKNIWIKRGDFVLVESIEEGDKVKAEISHILYKEQIKYIKAEGKWPSAFGPKVESDIDQMIPKDLLPPSDEDSDCEPLTANPNRPLMATGACSDTDSDTDSDSDVCDEGTTDGEVHVTREAVHFN